MLLSFFSLVVFVLNTTVIVPDYPNEKPCQSRVFSFNISELLRYVGRSYDGLTAAKAAFSVALGRMTRFTVSRLAW